MVKSVIRTINEDGSIIENAIYSLDPQKALIAYLEQTINRHYNTWQYDQSRFNQSIQPLRSGKGYGYNVPDKNISIAAYST
jgi:hypothetical protein